MRSDRRFYYLGLVLLAGLSFGLRFWQLGRFNSLVFDEVYYVKFAQAYLSRETVFDAHPPLGKMAIAVGIWLYAHIPWLHSATQTMTADVDLVPVSYRWMNALAGALVPLVVVGLAHALTDGRPEEMRQASRGWLFGILAGMFVAIDGLFVTESRYGLLNIYVVFLGLLGHWLWMFARREKQRGTEMVLRRVALRGVILRGVCGVALGGAIATKWNGLGYVLTLVLWEGWQQIRLRDAMPPRRLFGRVRVHPLVQGTFYLAFYLGVLPLLTYALIWWPHLQLNAESFLSIHRTLFLFHQGLDDVQVACSRWFTWPLLIKPIAYWYEQAGAQVYTVNNLGNPVLWWLSGAVILLLGIERFSWAAQNVRLRFGRFHFGSLRFGQNAEGDGQETLPIGRHCVDTPTDIAGYLLIGYLANWLPWMLVARCTYNYLFMPAAVFGFMLLAWRMSDWLSLSAPPVSRWVGFVMLCAIALAFFFWIPLALGSGLSPEQLQLRWWLPSWI